MVVWHQWRPQFIHVVNLPPRAPLLVQRGPLLCPCCGFVHGKARSVVVEGHNVTWQQGTSGKTVSPKLCAEERVEGVRRGVLRQTTRAADPHSSAGKESQHHPTAKRRRRCSLTNTNRREGKPLASVSGRGDSGAAVVARPSGAPRCSERIPHGGEAETGPPLTSVGLSVSCNRKWERRWREKTQSCIPPSSLH